MKGWFYVVLIPWLAVMAFGVLAFLDYGFDAVVITSQGVQYWVDIAIDAFILFLPLLVFPFARKKKDIN